MVDTVYQNNLKISEEVDDPAAKNFLHLSIWWQRQWNSRIWLNNPT